MPNCIDIAAQKPDMAEKKSRKAKRIKVEISDDSATNVVESTNEFKCPICMDFLVGAKNFSCGHTFCEQCVGMWFIREKVCPVCRAKI